MATPATSPVPVPARALWKQLVVHSLLGGAACGLVFAAGVIGLYWYTQRPKEWNKKALRTTSVRAEPVDRVDDKLQAISSGVVFSVYLENTTSRDITLPESVEVLQQEKGSHALHGSVLEMRDDYFVPSRHISILFLSSTEMCAAKRNPQACFDSHFKDYDEIVVLDRVQRYEIRIPIPNLTVPSDSQRLMETTK